MAEVMEKYKKACQVYKDLLAVHEQCKFAVVKTKELCHKFTERCDPFQDVPQQYYVFPQ